MSDRILTDRQTDRQTDIAIVVPVYNAQRNLKRCIDSIMNQDFPNFILILIDDGSKDRSGKICDEYAKRDKRVCVIHQSNQGSAEARRQGVLYEKTQSSKYVMFIDADDMISQTALGKLYRIAELYKADCVCGNYLRTWRGIKFSTYTAPCFQMEKPVVYEVDEIIQKLFVSCFGISNYPVSLYMKLYKRDLVTNVIKHKEKSRIFFGEDLNITMQLLPLTQRLVIIPDVVYYYRVGGGTSKFMPKMLDDSLELYRRKRCLWRKYHMPYDVELLASIELMNIVRSYLLMCIQKGKYSSNKLQEEISKLKCDSEIVSAAKIVEMRQGNHLIANYIVRQDSHGLRLYIENENNRMKLKMVIKDIVFSL